EHAKQLAATAAATAAAAATGGIAGSSAADLDLVALHQLATATSRAETAELRLHTLERDHGVLQADVAALKRQLQQQRQAREAAEERAAAAMQHMHACELRYMSQVEELQRQLAEAHRERWRHDLGLEPPRKRVSSGPVRTTATTVHAQASLLSQQKQQEQEQEPSRPKPCLDAELGGGGKRSGEAWLSGELISEVEGVEEAERLLRSAHPPPESVVGGYEQRVGITEEAEGLDPFGPDARFTVQHVESLVVGEDTSLEVLPEVARLLELQRRISGQA
ncbi:hypothetical protein Agub_g8660, partial [Astrephomene gubernaculifera]